ncbi:hypothetical protein [Paludisphaera soli]|uniref:hypothetical protein n=1 Tax=Paludisphaera soli TaxID=2712865 RepID=UPI0013ED57B5|nr:hypothetical protein [Paludisphaera soli]
MDESLLRSITHLAERLLSDAGRDEVLREDLRTLARAILEATETAEVQAPVAEAPPEPEAAETVVASPSCPPEPVRPPDVPLPELTLGRSPSPQPRLEVAAAPSAPSTTSDEDLAGIEARCRLKAEGLRWAAMRRRRIEEGADFTFEIAPRDREILDRARGIDCFLWMNTPDFSVPRIPTLHEDAAGCFDAVADGVSLVRGMLPDVEANRRFFEPALDLLAEAQSALRVAIERIDGRKDPDQFAAYDWLRGVAAREQIYIRRYMRLDDPASPSSHPRVQVRIEELDAGMQDVLRQGKKRKSLISRLRYHARRIDADQGDAHDWNKILATIVDLIDAGEPPSSVEIRETLLPILDRMPDLGEPPKSLGMVLREVDRYLAARRPDSAPEVPEAPTAEVAEAARLLAGKAVVIIGGARRPEAHAALKSALGLSDLIWIETREHESIERFEPSVARPDVALVILAIRWSSHSFGEVKTFCDDYAKPLLRLPGGYNPNQVARQILQQCSDRLQDGPSPAS